MLSHDQLAFAVIQLYPDLIHGKDFWVAHPVEPGSARQTGEAEIVAWPKDIPQPGHKKLHQTFDAHAKAFFAQQALAERHAKLAASDWTQLFDTPAAIREPWAAYRQALRDVPQQDGFPHAIAWPKPPDTSPRPAPKLEPKPKPEPKPAPEPKPDPKPLPPPDKPRRPGRPPPPFDPPGVT